MSYHNVVPLQGILFEPYQKNCEIRSRSIDRSVKENHSDIFYEGSQYRKLVETFHVVSECNTAVYFS
jgi:hypothetical protein